MELSAPQVFALLASAIAGFLLAHFPTRKLMHGMSEDNIALLKRISTLEGELASSKQAQAAEADRLRAGHLVEREAAKVEAFRKGERQAKARIEEQKPSFSIEVRPFVSKVFDEGLFRKTASVKVGYQYQMFVHGVPCFDPHLVIEEEYKMKKTDEEKIERLTKKALKFAEAAVSAKSGAAKALISLVRNPILADK